MATYSASTASLLLRVILLFGGVLAADKSFSQTQIVKGNIIDEASRTPIAGATIALISNHQIATTSDANGNFRLVSVPLGRQSFGITIVGYEPVFVSDVLITAGKEVFLSNVLMNESISTLDAVVVTAKNSRLPNNEMAVVSTKTFNMDETKRYAGSLGDPARMAANFAGVISTNDTRNDIIIRGNSPNSMLWQLEGLNIPNPNHFGALNSMGGSVSILNNNNIDKSDFIAGAFPAQYGNAMAGAFDIRLRKGNDETHEFVTQVGFNGFEAGAEGPIGQKNKATYIVNARYSTLAVFKQLGLQFGTGGGVPVYADINYKLNTPVGNRASISLFGIWGKSDFTSLAKDYSKGQAYGNDYSNRYADYRTNITGVSLDYRLAKNTTAKFTLGYSSTNEVFDRDSVSTVNADITAPDWHWKFNTRKYSAVLSVNHKFNAKHSIVGGLNNDYIDYSLLNKRIYGGTTDAILTNQNGSLMLTQAYVQWKYRLNETFSIIPGLHYQRLDLSKSQSIEPRVGISSRINKNHMLGFGFGMHSQMDNLLTYATVTQTANGPIHTNESLDFLRSTHFVLSHDWRLSNNTSLKTEVYYQYLYNLPVESHPSSFSTINLGAENTPTLRDSLVNEGTGRNYGLEITLERRFSKGLYYLLTTSLFDSKYKGSDGILRNTAFNMGYVVNILAGKEWLVSKKSTIGVSLKLSTVGGRYLSPIDIPASIEDGEVQYIESKAFSDRQRSYFRTDVKLSYRKDFKKSSLEISLDLQNVTNNENIFRQEWNARTLQVTNNYQQGFFPVPFVRFTF